MVPNNRENKIIYRLHQLMDELNSGRKNLQSDTTSFAEVQSIFYAVISTHLPTQAKLSRSEDIILHSSLDSAIIKV